MLLRESIEALLKISLGDVCVRLSDEYGCHYVGADSTAVLPSKSSRKKRQVLIADEAGNEYAVAGILTNQHVDPLLLFEVCFAANQDKFMRNICTTHSAIRRRYHSIRSSIAILAGSWSNSSIAMMESHDITIFLIPFDFICDQLEKVGVDFRWGEKEKEKAFAAWENYNQLTNEEQDQIGRAMIQVIEARLFGRIEDILDESVPREVDKVIIELISNLGEVKIFEFDSVDKAIEFLEQEGLEAHFVLTDSVTLFEPPPVYES